MTEPISAARKRMLRNLLRATGRVVRGIEYRDITVTRAERDLLLMLVELAR